MPLPGKCDLVVAAYDVRMVTDFLAIDGMCFYVGMFAIVINHVVTNRTLVMVLEEISLRFSISERRYHYGFPCLYFSCESTILLRLPCDTKRTFTALADKTHDVPDKQTTTTLQPRDKKENRYAFTPHRAKIRFI